jgi:predicted regulator of Ras-like GTPase activity (Roadblock/LC7/MglB family)
MQEILEEIVNNTPGAKGAILMGFDGIAVMQHAAEGDEDTDIESMAMEFSFRLTELREAAQSLEMGGLTDIMLRAEHGTVLFRVLSEEYFVAVFLGDTGHLGKGRWVLRSNAPSLAEEL